MDQLNPVLSLSPEECIAKLQSQVLGRVVTRVREITDIFPVNYVVDDGTILIRTAEGTKLLEMTIGGEVLFEVDQVTEERGWSVIVRGSAHLLKSEDEIAHAETLPLRPMIPTIKRNFVRIVPTLITGIEFERTEEPPRDGPQDY